ncbi:MAG: mercuric reductase [Betaproteobacteria bacterium]
MTTPDDVFEQQRLANVRPPDWRNPVPADRYHLVVVGAGPAGLIAAKGAAGLGARVALVEQNLIGGDCLNVGCVPSKALIRTARVYAEMRNASHYGAADPGHVQVDFAAAMAHMRRLRARISRSDSITGLTEAGIDVFLGHARFTATDSLDVDGVRLRFGRAMIATGSRPDTPSIEGLEHAGYLTNETVFDLTALPARLLVVGGGPLGCELAQAFSRFGASTIIAQDLPLFLPKEERDAAQLLSDAFARDGLEVRLNTTVTAVRKQDDDLWVDMVSDDYHSSVTVDAIMAGVGRLPNIEGMDLDAAGVEVDPKAGIQVDDFLRTSNRRIYAAGDVCLEHMYTDAADASARIVVRNALFPGKQRVSALTIPWCTYTDPEIAHVGLYVRQANQQGISVRTFTVPMHEIDRAILDGEQTGFVKIHVAQHSDKILGATIVARHAGEMINEITVAMVNGIGLNRLANVIHAYPTQAEAIRKAANASNRERLTPFIAGLLRWWIRR